MTILAIFAVGVALLVDGVLGFCYFAYSVGRKMRPLTIEMVQRIVKLHETSGKPFVLSGRMQMIAAIKHQIEDHGMLHKDDILAWLGKMNDEFQVEAKRLSETLGFEARRQLDEEERLAADEMKREPVDA